MNRTLTLRLPRLVLQAFALPLASEQLVVELAEPHYSLEFSIWSGHVQKFLQTWQRILHEPTMAYEHASSVEDFSDESAATRLESYRTYSLFTQGYGSYLMGNQYTPLSAGNVLLIGSNETGDIRAVSIQGITQTEILLSTEQREQVRVRFHLSDTSSLKSLLSLVGGEQ